MALLLPTLFIRPPSSQDNTTHSTVVCSLILPSPPLPRLNGKGIKPCIVLYLQPVLNPKSYDGARVLEASGRPMESSHGEGLSEVPFVTLSACTKHHHHQARMRCWC